MRQGGAHKRRDANEPAIRRGLHAIGAETWQITGAQRPDLLVLFRGRWTPLGVKTKTGRLRPGEDVAPWPLVRSLDEALRVIGAVL